VRIASGDNNWIGPVELFFDEAMREQAVRITNDGDLAHLEAVGGARVDRQHVARSERREHARAERAKAHVAVLAQRVGDERRRQELFFTAEHWPILGFVLPHASAIVSNSCSFENPGF
jgi:hypothetical protein